MTNTTQIEQNLETWATNMKEAMDPEFDLTTAEEISLDQTTFDNNEIVEKDWDTIVAKCKECLAFSATQCGLTKVAAPSKELPLEVVDFSENAISDISFVKKFPALVSLTLADTKLAKMEDLEVLKSLEKLQILEVVTEDNLGFGADEEGEEKLHKAVFELLPELISFNQLDKEGAPVMLGNEEDEEEDFGEMYGNMEEEDLDDLLYEEEDEDELELEGEEGIEGEEGDDVEEEADEEPAAKRQKTE